MGTAGSRVMIGSVFGICFPPKVYSIGRFFPPRPRCSYEKVHCFQRSHYFYRITVDKRFFLSQNKLWYDKDICIFESQWKRSGSWRRVHSSARSEEHTSELQSL